MSSILNLRLDLIETLDNILTLRLHPGYRLISLRKYRLLGNPMQCRMYGDYHL
jgi:hypothetical protein